MEAIGYLYTFPSYLPSFRGVYARFVSFAKGKGGRRLNKPPQKKSSKKKGGVKTCALWPKRCENHRRIYFCETTLSFVRLLPFQKGKNASSKNRKASTARRRQREAPEEGAGPRAHSPTTIPPHPHTQARNHGRGLGIYGACVGPQALAGGADRVE